MMLERDTRCMSFLAHNLDYVSTPDGGYYRLTSNPSRKELNLFARFRFPTMGMAKLETKKNARKYGFDQILEETWFCQTPTPNEQPCGYCNPCSFAKKEGFLRRIPNLTLRSRLYWFFRSWVHRVEMSTVRRRVPLAPTLDRKHDLEASGVNTQ